MLLSIRRWVTRRTQATGAETSTVIAPGGGFVSRAAGQSSSMRLLADALLVGRRAVAEARDDRITTTAQAIAYSIFLAIPASLFVLLGVFSLVADERLVDELIERAQTVMPEEAATLLRDSLQRTSESAGSGILLTVVGLALALWTTTSAAGTLMDGLTTAYDRADGRSFVRKRLLALAIVACLVLAALLVIGLLVLGPHLQRWVGGALDAESATAWIWWTAQWPLLVGGLLFAFAVLLYLGPDVDRPRWRLISPGAVTAVVVWLAASAGFAVYTANFGSYNKSWGTLSAVVITLVWLWLTSAALLFSAEVNAEAQRLAEERDPLRPREPAQRRRAQSKAA
jgi:membrane protein